MKKLLTVLAASVGIAAFAAEGDPLSATSFENYSGDFSVTKGDAGGDSVPAGDRTWAGDADADGDTNVITEYGEATKPANRPDYYAGNNQAQSKFLKVDSTAGLARYVNAGGGAQGLGSNVYFDMDVQFTVSDSVQEAAEGDKLLVWLYAPDTENAQTNLVITAATIASNLETTPVNYVVAVPETSVQADTWYRLTVVSTTKDVSSAAVPHFQVYIDGKQAIPTGTMASDGAITALLGHDGLFGSLVAYNQEDDTTTTLTSVTFKGTGAVDDLVVTTVKPSFIPEDVLPFAIGDQPYASLADALDAAEDSDVIKVMANNTSDIGEIGEATIDLNGKTLTFSADEIEVTVGLVFINSAAAEATVAGSEGTTFLVQDGTLTIGASDDAGAVTMTAVIAAYNTVKVYGSNTKPALSNDGDLKAWSTAADEDGYYTAVAGGGEPTSDTYDIPGDASLSDGGTITVPNGTAKIKLGDNDVTAGFTINGTTATLKAPVIEATADTTDEDTKDEALVVTDTEVKIGVKAVKGLYYGVGSSTDVTKVARPAALIKFTGDNRVEIFTKDKTENADGEFYKVYVDIKAE